MVFVVACSHDVCDRVQLVLGCTGRTEDLLCRTRERGAKGAPHRVQAPELHTQRRVSVASDVSLEECRTEVQALGCGRSRIVERLTFSAQRAEYRRLERLRRMIAR